MLAHDALVGVNASHNAEARQIACHCLTIKLCVRDREGGLWDGAHGMNVSKSSVPDTHHAFMPNIADGIGPSQHEWGALSRPFAYHLKSRSKYK